MTPRDPETSTAYIVFGLFVLAALLLVLGFCWRCWPSAGG
jgi:hypothetical protein